MLARRNRLRRGRGRHTGRRVGVGLAFVLLLLALVAAVGGAGLAGKALLSDCSLSSLRPVALGENSFVYAADRSFLGAIPSSTERQPLPLWRISRWLPKATVAIEDRRFYQHGGLDYQAIVRAALADLSAGRVVQGGSTITEQLVRNLSPGSQRRTIGRKIEEACLANKLDGRLTKRQILDDYLNLVFYGRHSFGAEAAAETFFSRHASQLTLPQAALIAGLAQSPSAYDPFVRPRIARSRRNEVLRAMLQSRMITPREFEWATRVPLRLEGGRLYLDIYYPNFFGFAEGQLVRRFGARRVENGGLKVQTTIDPRLQTAAYGVMKAHLPRRDDPAASLVAIDPWTGAIRAMTNYLPGGQRLQFNLATQSGRQAGSSFKPFVLATAIDRGVSIETPFEGPSQITIPDRRCRTGNAPWTVHNYADESTGTMSLIDATANSVNTIFAQLVERIGPSNVVPVAHRLGITTPLRAVCSITLGTQPVNPLEMTDAYATLARRGIHHPPQALQEVRGPNRTVLYKLGSPGTRAIPKQTADLVTYVLQAVVRKGTGTAAALQDRPVAGKTGTAQNYVDAWFCGYVQQLAACVWVGYPRRETPLRNVEGVPEVVGGSIPAAIWHDFMTVALQHVPPSDFVQPATIPGATSPPTNAGATYSH